MDIPKDHKPENEKYYLNLPVWPEFAIYNKTVDGLIPSCRIESWEEFDRVVAYYCDNDSEGHYVFRGQKHYKWELEPTLDRLVGHAVSEEIAKKQLKNFRLSTRGRLNDKSVLSSDSELWALGQHHGLATPLLDWSLSPYVSLFFAFEGADDPTWLDDNGDCSNYSRTIFILNRHFIEDEYEKALENSEPENTEGQYLRIVEPAIDDHGRLVNQAGLFTFAPYDEKLESSLYTLLSEKGIDVEDVNEVAKYICCIHVPNEPDTRNKCLKKLHKMNIHHASIFPDLIGSSGYCNDLIREAVLAKKKKASSQDIRLSEGAPENKLSVQVSISETSSSNDYDVALQSRRDELNEALSFDEQVSAVSYYRLAPVIDFIIDFAKSAPGIDWYKKENLLAKLRISISHQLRKTEYPQEQIPVAAKNLANIVASICAEHDSLAEASV
ncbi:hypothetical protein DN730_11485 [Marinomonas piezotolerans]|uniref:FRG domain-containing protein n=1 Tax=Marinomonas piezotolerans TaxID=2213058 RepID=A0A370U7M5_9GAMM|nr:FRG domain-containing protein [Marinomonas piezotolerans]RDL43800.1 hypothetical protein DN730_11485 [Marinomonas piezotolerans]